MALENPRERSRLTIYLGGTERRKLLDWAKQFTRAASESEAIFSALALLKDNLEESQKQERKQVASRLKGTWAQHNSKLNKMVAELEKGWKAWDREIS